MAGISRIVESLCHFWVTRRGGDFGWNRSAIFRLPPVRNEVLEVRCPASLSLCITSVKYAQGSTPCRRHVDSRENDLARSWDPCFLNKGPEGLPDPHQVNISGSQGTDLSHTLPQRGIRVKVKEAQHNLLVPPIQSIGNYVNRWFIWWG